jgi:hypothetical protein
MATKEIKRHLINEYRDAIELSPLWVKVAFKSFLLLPNKYVLNNPFLIYILGKDPSVFKMDKKTAEYGLSRVNSQYCENCIYSNKNIVEDKYFCFQVRGDINTKEWCKLWKGKTT